MSEAPTFAPVQPPPRFVILVNFGVVVGREVADGEVERLGMLLRPEVGSVAVIAERRHEFGRESHTAMHQVRIEVDEQAAASLTTRQHESIETIADHWVRECQSHQVARTLSERLGRQAVTDAQGVAPVDERD